MSLCRMQIAPDLKIILQSTLTSKVASNEHNKSAKNTTLNCNESFLERTLLIRYISGCIYVH